MSNIRELKKTIKDLDRSIFFLLIIAIETIVFNLESLISVMLRKNET